MAKVGTLAAGVFVWPLQAHSASGQNDIFRVSSGPDCGGTFYAYMQVPYPSGITTWVTTPRWRELVRPEFRTELLEAAFKASLAQCKAQGRNAGFAAIVVGQDGNNILIAWTSATDRTWHVTFDQVGQTVAMIEARERANAAEAEARQQREEAERRAREAKAQAEAKEKEMRAEASRKFRESFINTNNVVGWVSVQALQANPFPYQGKILGLGARFSRMISASEALFGDLHVAGVPSTLFTVQNQAVVLAIKVEGIKTIRSVIGTDVQVPSGTYSGVYICKQDDCREFFGQ